MKPTVFLLKEAQGDQGNIIGLYVSCLGSVIIFFCFCFAIFHLFTPSVNNLEKKRGAFLFRLIQGKIGV